MKRRDFIMTGAAAVASANALAKTEEQKGGVAVDNITHDFQSVIALAEERSKKEDKPKTQQLSAPFDNLSYDQYRGIRFKKDKDPFMSLDTNFAMDLLPPSQNFKDWVDIYLVKDGVVEAVSFNSANLDFDPNFFTNTQMILDDQAASQMSWSGFRLRYPLNAPDINDEFAVFQGASYFRAIARDTLYGLSARGLAISTGEQTGEEFPRFTAFWITPPTGKERSIVVDALLESKSITGAYHMLITPGEETIFEIQSVLFPRVDINSIGIAPLTSMYFFSPSRRNQIDDYRNAVHDSDGLAITTSSHKQLWRALANPSRLSFSVFSDEKTEKFGLVQRNQSFADYQDIEAKYEKRPCAWVTPTNNWGKGSVNLIEIPVNTEFNDNIVAFWRPKTSLMAKQRYDYNYTLSWSKKVSDNTYLRKVIATRIGKSINKNGVFSFFIDYDDNAYATNVDDFLINVDASTGQILSKTIQHLPDQKTIRVAFEFQPDKSKLSELQLNLTNHDRTMLSETWMYQWNS